MGKNSTTKNKYLIVIKSDRCPDDNTWYVEYDCFIHSDPNYEYGLTNNPLEAKVFGWYTLIERRNLYRELKIQHEEILLTKDDILKNKNTMIQKKIEDDWTKYVKGENYEQWNS